ncbi:CMRF35-like molecule 5 [Saccopteryx leptura]|uniref:CMRF35-like molecule 5 n=1 Tax=Saccopteryx leptura TaxID=249018 RepID=UPI00339C0D7F
MWLLLPLLLLIIPGSSYEITGPKEVSVLEQGSLTVQCRYDPKWETYRKWWCRGAEWDPCKILLKTTGTEWEVKRDHVSIRDNQRSHVFTVTMEKLRREDTGVYWCGIERTGADLGTQVNVTIGPGSSYEITGPEEVSGLEQGSLTVQCHYDPKWKTYRKWWCRGAEWSGCKDLVKTTGTEWEVKSDHVSIRDNQRSHVFTVTMEKLRREDTGVYWCGIERTGVDLGTRVNVTIGPARVLTTTAVTSNPNVTFTTTVTSATNMITVPVSSEDTTGSLTVTSHHSNDGSLLINVHFLLLVFLKVPLLLSMLGAVLWVNRPQRSSRGKQTQPHSENQ